MLGLLVILMLVKMFLKGVSDTISISVYIIYSSFGLRYLTHAPCFIHAISVILRLSTLSLWKDFLVTIDIEDSMSNPCKQHLTFFYIKIKSDQSHF